MPLAGVMNFFFKLTNITVESDNNMIADRNVLDIHILLITGRFTHLKVQNSSSFTLVGRS
jgi:hypothetical protein